MQEVKPVDSVECFAEGQWWLAELDQMVREGTHDQKRAVAVVRNLLRTANREQVIWTPTSTGCLPPKETPVLIMVRGKRRIGEIRTEHPGFEDTFRAYDYWDDPDDEGQDWEWHEVTHWAPLFAAPETEGT